MSHTDVSLNIRVRLPAQHILDLLKSFEVDPAQDKERDGGSLQLNSKRLGLLNI